MSSDETKGEESQTSASNVKVVYKFCDLNREMVSAWKEQFKDYIPDHVQVCYGDIFKEGPAADAIVSPANSFGFMDGGIDMAYSRHFGWQMQTRLQTLIRETHHGELLVGEAVIIPTMDKGDWKQNAVNWSAYNEGQPIKHLISAPTMRVPCDVSATANAYLAFRGIILSVQKFNETAGDEPIRSVLCPGLGTMVGRMPADRCAFQMLQAYETFEVGLHTERLCPQHLEEELTDHFSLTNFGSFRTKSQLDSAKTKSSKKSSKIQELSSQLQKGNLSDD